MEFEVKTGYGYFKDENGRIVAKAILPKGKHPIKKGYKYVEVASEKELNSIKISIDNKRLTEKERLIIEKQNEILRRMAIQELKKEGKLK